MKPVTALLVALLIAAPLSACIDSGRGKTTADPSDTTAPSTSAPASNNATPPTQPNATEPTTQVEPIANLTADVQNGSAPLSVNFTLADDAAASNVTWVLDFGDGNTTNGTELPATANHTFLQAGNVTVLLTVAGPTGNSTANLTLIIESGATILQTVRGDFLETATACAWPFPTWAFGPLDGISTVEFAVDPQTIGKEFTAVFTYTDPVIDFSIGIVEFFDADDMYIDSFDALTPAPTKGTVPAGAVNAILHSCGESPGSVLYTA